MSSLFKAAMRTKIGGVVQQELKLARVWLSCHNLLLYLVAFSSVSCVYKIKFSFS